MLIITGTDQLKAKNEVNDNNSKYEDLNNDSGDCGKEFSRVQKKLATVSKVKKTMNILGSAVTAIKPRNDDSFIDRLNYYYSTVIIMVMSLTISAKQYVGQPIQCWVPGEFSKAWEQYAENYCFVHNTYWVRPNEEIPQDYNERINKQLIYYQWVPFIMALQAVFFYIPILFWGAINRMSGLNVPNVVRLAECAADTEEEERSKNITAICTHIEDSIRMQINHRKTASPCERVVKFGLYDGSFIRNMYIITKLLFIWNLYIQFYLMNLFLGQNSTLWGASILYDIARGKNWEYSGNFPRTAICDFNVRVLGNLQRYSIQCVLVLNMFNEKIFLFIYWWFVFVAILTTGEAVFWLINTQILSRRIVYASKHIPLSSKDERLFQKFCDSKINTDVILIFRLISMRTNDLIVSDVLQMLWSTYKTRSHLDSVSIASNIDEYNDGVKYTSIQKYSLNNLNHRYGYPRSPQTLNSPDTDSLIK
uniref:Innexin n=1 Tax=Strongyloides venezuelensis TaxID=75913 RepID=A0A0K0F2X0_STRVS